MNLAELSIRRPIFITSIVFLILAIGFVCMNKLAIDLFPDITFPVITITTPYPGAGPSEIETLITQPLEDEMSTLSGLKRLTSMNSEGMSQLVAEFSMETKIQFAEQQVRDRIQATQRKLPRDVEPSTIRRIDPADQPIVMIALKADASMGQLYNLADQKIRPQLEQVNQVGRVEILGGRKREIQVQLDRHQLKLHDLSVVSVAQLLTTTGENIPNGKINSGNKETIFRTLGEFQSLQDLSHTLIKFFGNEIPTTLGELGTITDSLEDETSRAFLNGEKILTLSVYRQTGSNTIAVVQDVKKKITWLNEEFSKQPHQPQLTLIRDGSQWIQVNVEDVKESILIGIFLTIFVVYLFLASGRSTLITGLAIPNSLLGAFILMSLADFSINIMTLLALSLSVGLLIDDAIVVRENIFRHLEEGMPPREAALRGTLEVQMAVIATTLTVIAVFGPVGFLKGITGQFFKQFGLTICFAMLISLFDALTVAPMLSAYFAHRPGKKASTILNRFLEKFDHFQTTLEVYYGQLLEQILKHPLKTLSTSLLVFILSTSTVRSISKTFLPPQDAGEFTLSLDLPPGSSLENMDQVAHQVDTQIRSNPEIQLSALTVGKPGKPETADFYIRLVPAKKRSLNTSEMKQKIRDQLKPLAFANPQVKDYDAIAGGQRPFNVNLISINPKELEEVGFQATQFMKQLPGLKDVDNNFRPGKPEYQITLIQKKSKQLGVTSGPLGEELRGQIQGIVPAKFHEMGQEYDIRVRLKESERDLNQAFSKTYTPNINHQLVLLKDVAKSISTTGPATIHRQNRGRLFQISADLTPGFGIGELMTQVKQYFQEAHLPPGMTYTFVGQAENFTELASSITLAISLAILFIFLVLSSLYESFITPLTIMLALPLALCGSLVALWMTNSSLNIFSMIGIIMLLGIATKNSILLVDYANQKIQEGMLRSTALIQAGQKRLRPILMTTMALIAGTTPIALGLNEASRQRTSMGIAIIGGLISSTLLTLIVVPAAFIYIDQFRMYVRKILKFSNKSL